ncbi:hypothetical protein I3842_07G219300 [Carya illinoinensis]|uniref:Uncharacterized protein n=1 Tax=Carya illinoinensis TaxID=32201 RepID=A0A922JJ90_CARIL|nr:hypothetical protein I3842_07G219300 [Carya illinoinensis]
MGLSMVMGLNKVITSYIAASMRVSEVSIMGRDVLGLKEGTLVSIGSKDGDGLGLKTRAASKAHDPRPTSSRAGVSVNMDGALSLPMGQPIQHVSPNPRAENTRVENPSTRTSRVLRVVNQSANCDPPVQTLPATSLTTLPAQKQPTNTVVNSVLPASSPKASTEPFSDINQSANCDLLVQTLPATSPTTLPAQKQPTNTVVTLVLPAFSPEALAEPFSPVEATRLDSISGSQATTPSPRSQQELTVSGDHSAPILASTLAVNSSNGMKLSLPLGPNVGDASDTSQHSLGLSKSLSWILETELEVADNSSVDGSTSDEGSLYGSDLQLVCKEFGADALATDLYVPGDTPSPLCSLPPTEPSADPQVDWIFQKIKDMSHFLGMSCEGYEDQLQALLIAIKSGQPLLARLAMKKDRELKRLACSINYDAREGSVCRGRHKDRVNLGDP